MKRYPLEALILITIFLASLPGIALAGITPDPHAVYTMAGPNMTLDTGGAHFTLQKGETIKITHAGKTWTLTAKAYTTGYVVVKGGALSFTYNAALLAVAAPAAGGVFGMSTATATTLGGLGAAGAAGAIAAGVSQGHGSSTPPVSPH